MEIVHSLGTTEPCEPREPTAGQVEMSVYVAVHDGNQQQLRGGYTREPGRQNPERGSQPDQPGALRHEAFVAPPAIKNLRAACVLGVRIQGVMDPDVERAQPAARTMRQIVSDPDHERGEVVDSYSSSQHSQALPDHGHSGHAAILLGAVRRLYARAPALC